MLHHHAVPLLAAFTYEVGGVQLALSMDLHLPPVGSSKVLPRLPRRSQRKQGNIQRLANMVGRSWQVRSPELHTF